MAAWLIVVVLAGFLPDSVEKIDAVAAGQRPPFPMVMHVHAVLMGAWLLLLLAQATLMATGRPFLHFRFGLASLVLAPAILAAGTLLAIGGNIGLHAALAQAPPGPAHDAVLRQATFGANISLFQFRAGLALSALFAVALWARRKHPDIHKRLMVLITATPVTASITRMDWLPSTMPASPLTIDVYLMLLVSPMFLWDLYRTRRVLPAYLIWLAVIVPTSLAGNLLWGTDYWLHEVWRLPAA